MLAERRGGRMGTSCPFLSCHVVCEAAACERTHTMQGLGECSGDPAVTVQGMFPRRPSRCVAFIRLQVDSTREMM